MGSGAGSTFRFLRSCLPVSLWSACFPGMNSRDRFLAALRCEPLDRPPVWVMRQAGRYLPEYRELKERHGFLGLVRTPELAAEVTLQPLRRFDLDAAILFSDILVIPEALGMGYDFRDGGGISMEYACRDRDGLRRLELRGLCDRLSYVGAALRLLRGGLGDSKALLGFGGSPWTLATYMVEGGNSENFSAIKKLYYQDPELLEELLSLVSDALCAFFRMQIEAGVDAIQIFDSWGAACPGPLYERLSLRWIRRIIAGLPPDFPVIVYAKGMHGFAREIEDAGARVIGVDWTVCLPGFRRLLDASVGVQGNLDPVLMDTTPAIVERATRELLESMRGLDGHILNLGHGIQPTARIDCMEALVATATSFR